MLHDTPPKGFVIRHKPTGKWWGTSVYGTVAAAKNSWNAHTHLRDVYPDYEGYTWKHATFNKDGHDYEVIPIKVEWTEVSV